MKTNNAMAAVLILLMLMEAFGASCSPIRTTTLTTTLSTSSTLSTTLSTLTTSTLATTSTLGTTSSMTTTINSPKPTTTIISKSQTGGKGVYGSTGGISCYECERARLIKLGSSYFIVNGSAVVSQRGSVVVRFYNPSLGLVCVNYGDDHGDDLVWCGLPLSSCTGKPSHMFAC